MKIKGIKGVKGYKSIKNRKTLNKEIFRNNVEGIYLSDLKDSVDRGHLFQDSTGAIPVTGVEQPVGKVIEGSPNGNSIIQPTDADRPILSARVNMLEETATLSTQSVTTSAGDYVVSFSGAGSITFSGTNTDIVTAGSTTITCSAGTLTATVTGNVTQADLRPVDQATGLIPAYQRVGDVDNDPVDYDWENFPWYLSFNGVNTWMKVEGMTPDSDEVFICTGVRKGVDPNLYSSIFELGSNSSNAGTCTVGARIASEGYRISSNGGGFRQAVAGSGYGAPITNVVRGFAKIGDNICTIYVDNQIKESEINEQGSGNYANYTLYIGSRAGSTYFFNGNIYSLILAFKIPSNRAISKAERLVNKNTKAY